MTLEINSFHANVMFLYPLEASKKKSVYLMFSGVIEIVKRVRPTVHQFKNNFDYVKITDHKQRQI